VGNRAIGSSRVLVRRPIGCSFVVQGRAGFAEYLVADVPVQCLLANRVDPTAK